MLIKKEMANMAAPEAMTVYIPLKRIFIAAGSRRKLSDAPHWISEPVSRKNPKWVDAANQVRRLNKSAGSHNQKEDELTIRRLPDITEPIVNECRVTVGAVAGL